MRKWLVNPAKFPFGSGGYHSEQERSITLRKYFNQRLLNVDSRFARDVEYLFTAQYMVETKQINDEANNYIFRQKCSRIYIDQTITAALLNP